jgi:hypothetical protein
MTWLAVVALWLALQLPIAIFVGKAIKWGGQ